MRISAVRCFEVQGPAEIPAQEERQVGMLDIYPHFASRPPAGPRDHQTGVYVQVEEAGGAYGLFGPIFPETVPLIQNKLAPMITGQDPRAGEYLWDVMYRSDRHARKGYLMMAWRRGVVMRSG
jgi:L-alanine-DL-glutamate epimerase-like enolase superfamily enzyme